MREIEFTAASFMRISVLEARRGRDDPAQQFASVSPVIDKLRDAHKSRRDACAGLWRTDPERARAVYAGFRAQIAELQAAKRSALRIELTVASAELSSALREDRFGWDLTPGVLVAKRQTYRIAQDAVRYFAMKQLELNLRSAYRLRSPNRNMLVAQLRDSLEGKLPRYVLRTDLAAFYESIPHDALIALLDEQGLLSRTSMQLVRTLLQEWRALVSRDRGLPTGVGISTHLAEVFAREIDRELSGDESVHFYARYVDDIVVISRTDQAHRECEARLVREVGRLGLVLNSSKTQKCVPTPSSAAAYDLSRSFDYLGYNIGRTGGVVRVEMSKDAIARYKARLDVAFAQWVAASPRTTGHDGLLLDRVRFLTGNTKLANSKGRAFTGIYFNYPALAANANSLTALDKYLANTFKKHESMMSAALKKRVDHASFSAGFASRVFHRFRQSDLVRVVAAWRE